MVLRLSAAWMIILENKITHKQKKTTDEHNKLCECTYKGTIETYRQEL